MFKAILFTQWKWTRMPLSLAAVAAFSVPVLSLRGAGTSAASPGRFLSETRPVLESLERWSIVYPLVALGAALAVALLAWNADHRGRHIYALSLPLPRWRYALLRFGAGSVLLAAPIAATGLGALVALAVTTVPPGTEGHPFALTTRFALATFLAYAIFFAIGAGTTRTAGWILAGLATLVGGSVFVVASGVDWQVFDQLAQILFVRSGMFGIFTGRWMLIDV